MTDIEVRNLRFQLDASIPRFWFGGSAAKTALFDSLSPFFPAGERFFVESVKRALPHVANPQLQRKARAFCGQEAMHTREHIHYNQMLEARGYPALRLERAVTGFLKLVRAITLPRQRLAITCALEHFTATGALRILQREVFRDAEPRMRAFWNWHAAEELEHRSIPYDVYLAVGGNYLERVFFMLMTSIVFQLYMLLHLFSFMWVDRVLFTRRAFAELGSVMRDMGGRKALWRDQLAYYRPGFHPSQLDDRQELTRFRAELTTSPIYASARGQMTWL